MTKLSEIMEKSHFHYGLIYILYKYKCAEVQGDTFNRKQRSFYDWSDFEASFSEVRRPNK